MAQLKKIHWETLDYLSKNTNATIEEMAEYFGITPMPMWFRIERLIKKGYVARTGKARSIKILKGV